MRVHGAIPIRLLAACALALFVAAKPAATPPQSFPTPEAAVEALDAAVKSGDRNAVLAIFGSAAKDLVQSADPVADKNRHDEFATDLAESHKIERDGDDKATLIYGDDDFPFPVPLVKSGDAWHFDADAGREEILKRRIGRDELSAIQVCLAYVDAQREYANTDGDRDGLYNYAEKILSTPGKKDGLYWPTKAGQKDSPLGELVAQAQSQGYKYHGKQEPYYGYYYKVLKGQGSHAAGGAYDYMVRGRMIGGFALVAWPAEYGNSGIMTFVVNHDGVVYSKDLGPDTAKLASEMTRYDPDASWKQEE